jgi:transposase-like protein
MAVSGRRPRKQKPEVKSDMNLVKLIEMFHSEDSCREYLEHIRWPNGIACLRCGNTSVSRVLQRGQIDCNSCRYQFSVTAGTMLQDTHLPLWKWFLAIYTIIESKKGVSANQLKRELDVSYKTAWYLCHRIRAAMSQAADGEERVLLTGTIEMDETFVGGKTEGKGRGYKGNKALVVGVVERGGEVILQIATDRTRKTLHEIALKHIAPEAVAMFTDEWPAYAGVGDHDTRHETVNHSRDEYVRGNVHTNTVEGVWSLLKRSITGAFHHVSVKHLDKYLSELEWRYGNRENPYLFRDTLLELLQSEHLEYKELTA